MHRRYAWTRSQFLSPVDVTLRRQFERIEKSAIEAAAGIA